MCSQGLTNKEIGRTLYITEATVKKHVRNASTKLGVRSRTEAAMRVAELSGWRDLGRRCGLAARAAEIEAALLAVEQAADVLPVRTSTPAPAAPPKAITGHGYPMPYASGASDAAATIEASEA